MELVGEALVVGRVRAELVSPIADAVGLELAGNLVTDHDDRLDLVVVEGLQELRERDRVLRLAGKGVREIPDQDPDNNEDHPEQ